MTRRSAPTSSGLSIRIGIPVFTPGPIARHSALEVALGQLLELGAERRHHRGDADGVDVAEADPAEGEQAGDPLGELVAGRPGAGLEAPVLDEALALEGAEMGLGVADVDREQHRRSRLSPTTAGRGKSSE